MAGTMQPGAGGLLAKKGTARPAMRRQSQVQQAGFGSANAGGLSGWLTGAEDDCGWNDMGDGAASTPNFGQRSAIGLTAMSNSADSLYVNGGSSDPDWDEADSYDDEASEWNASAPAWSPSPPANPVGEMQERLHAAATQPVAAAPAAEEHVYEEPVEEEIPVGLFGQIRAAWAHFMALIFGRGPVTVLHLNPALREQLRNAAGRQGIREADFAEHAIEEYLGKQAGSGATTPPAGTSWN